MEKVGIHLRSSPTTAFYNCDVEFAHPMWAYGVAFA